MLRIGTAGWDYRDWQGVVYPPGLKGTDRLIFLAGLFDVVEVNVTFYRPVDPQLTELLQNETIQSMICQKALLRPEVGPELCSGCGTCIDQCPVSALSMNGDPPQVDADTCITCFCCQEICPEKAITLR